MKSLEGITKNIEIMSSLRNGIFGGGSSLTAALLTIDIHSWFEPILLGLTATLLTTTLSFFWKKFLNKKFDSPEKEED